MFFKSKVSSPFAPDSSNYFLPLMVMIMVFLAVLSSAIGLSLQKALEKWENSITGSITIQVLPSVAEIDDKELFISNIEKLITALKGTPGIKDARYLNDSEINRLLNPWFGNNEIINDLPIPQVIDVTLADDINIDLDVLKSIVAYQSENASIDIHQAWLKRLTDLIASIKFLAYSVLLIILGTTVLLVIYATTTNVSLHKNVISLLHLIGAKDFYIAGQISIKAALLSLKGAAIGFVIVVPVIIMIGSYINEFDSSLNSIISLNIKDWMILFLCAIMASLVSGVSAYITVFKKLKKML